MLRTGIFRPPQAAVAPLREPLPFGRSRATRASQAGPMCIEGEDGTNAERAGTSNGPHVQEVSDAGAQETPPWGGQGAQGVQLAVRGRIERVVVRRDRLVVKRRPGDHQPIAEGPEP